MISLRVLTLLLTLPGVVAAGTVFFRYVEGWSWVDSYFFTVVTLSTVGYGDPVPVTTLGKLGTTVFIFAGLGIFAVTIQQVGLFAMRKREEHTEWLVAHLRREPGKSPAANEDDPPESRD